MSIAVRMLFCLSATSLCLACSDPVSETAAPHRPTASNPIVAENLLPGSPPTEWDIQPRRLPGIEGFATEFSVPQGRTVRFKIRTDARVYRLDLYRLGYYGGDGARLVDSFRPTRVGKQPACRLAPTTKLLDCSNWFESASWVVPEDAVSGVYLAKLVVSKAGGELSSHIWFVVREAKPRAELLFQTSDTTWQAYNHWGDSEGRGYSLYRGPPKPGAGPRRAREVSYHRPFRIGRKRGPPAQHFRDGRHGFFAAEYPMVRFLERNGYDLGYATAADTARFGDRLLAYDVFLSVGHDEYWSAEQRRNVERARDAGVHLAFFGGNSVYWKIAWDEHYQSFTCDKDESALDDEHQRGVSTGMWRSAPNPGDVPENALTGVLGYSEGEQALLVPASLGRLRFWRDTRFAQTPLDEVARSVDRIVGYERDWDPPNAFRPPGLMRLSSTPLKDWRRSTHHATLYRQVDSGALVFAAGTIQWSWGLESPPPRHRVPRTGTVEISPDPALQQATVNLLADMGVQPATLQPGILHATPSTDGRPPETRLAALPARVPLGAELEIRGTAEDQDGKIGAVEVWHVDRWLYAEGQEEWSLRFVPELPGPLEIRARAVDDSGNLGEPTATRIVEIIDTVADAQSVERERPGG